MTNRKPRDIFFFEWRTKSRIFAIQISYTFTRLLEYLFCYFFLIWFWLSLMSILSTFSSWYQCMEQRFPFLKVFHFCYTYQSCTNIESAVLHYVFMSVLQNIKESTRSEETSFSLCLCYLIIISLSSNFRTFLHIQPTKLAFLGSNAFNIN